MPAERLRGVASAGEGRPEPNDARSIVFVITGLGVGGAEAQVTILARELRRRGWDVSLVSLIEPTAFTDLLAEADVSVASLGMRPGVADPRGLIRLVRLLRRRRPAVVHCHMIHANLLGRAARCISPAPVLICSAHSVDEGGPLRERLYRLTDRWCSLTTSVCRAGVQRYIERGIAVPGRIRYMPNAVDTVSFQPNPVLRARVRAQLGVREDFVWLAVGRLEAPKDYPTMLEAFAAGRAGRSRLIVAGEGSERASLEALVRRLGLAGRVRFLGLRSDVPQLLQAADGFVMSSAWEGMPMVLLEAGAAGLPIVATEVGGIPEIVMHGDGGMLVPPASPASLAAALETIEALEPEARTRMGAAARERVVRHHGLAEVADRWEALYSDLAAAATTRTSSARAG